MNLRAFIESRVAKHPAKPFLYFQKEVLSYEAFDRKVNQAANGFLEWGVKKGDRVVLLLSNRPEFLYAWFGLAKIGAVMVPLNTGFKEKEAGYVVIHSEAVGLIFERESLPVARAIQKETPTLKWIACADSVFEEGIFSLPELFRNASPRLKGIDLASGDMAQIIYTSGTTGFPKGVIHAHKDFTLTGEAFTLCAGIGPEDRVMTILPLFHANASYYSTMGALAAGASLILLPRFSAGAFWDQAVETGATEFNFIGAVGRILCARPETEFRPEHRVKTAYGALVTPDVYETFTRRFKIPNVLDGYGLSEVPRVSQNPIGGVIKMKSMGLPARHPNPKLTFSEVRIVDDQGRDLGPGETGELIVRSPVMMQGYFKDEEKTRETIRDGWLYTGDYVYRDEDEYLFFVDRKKDIIRRKGENISATEIEMALMAHPKVLEAAVIAVPSELGEDEVLAGILLKENQTMTAEEVMDWCQPKLANFKIPRYVQFRSDFPRTPTQRIAKYIWKKEGDLIRFSQDMESYKKKMGL
jgi:crotonobetaine/carnitine-CoA ligase